MEKLELALEPHPWQQFRYGLSKEQAPDPSRPPLLGRKSVHNKE